MVALIDQPTTRRENKSSTAATYSQPSAVQMYVKSAIHLRLGAGAWKAERLAFGENDQLHHCKRRFQATSLSAGMVG